MSYNHNYSNVICIGDEFTDEVNQYKKLNFWDFFKEKKYEFKSYPQLLGENLNCPWEIFAKNGITTTESISQLTNNLDYIFSLNNPLIIFQFGDFFNPIFDDNSGNNVDIIKNYIISENIQNFVNISELIHKYKSIDIFAFFMYLPNVELPNTKHILKSFKTGCEYETISNLFDEIPNLNLKSTNGNIKLSNMILRDLFPVKNLF
jgi:hypothetical protein